MATGGSGATGRPPLIKHPPMKCGTPVVITSPPSTSSSKASTWDVGEKKKRWMVIGIALNHVLLPALRDFVGTEISAFYNTQKTIKGIDRQVRGTHWNKDKGFTLNYGSINNNFGLLKKKSHFYDYRVLSAVDLGKLYLEPHMAKCTGFDNTCDLSAVLGMLSNSSVFSTMIQNNAKDVRSSVRNEWGHCNFDNWDITKFGRSFQQMETLIRSLGLPSPKDTETVQDLKEWEKRGTQLCLGSPVDADLLKLVQGDVDTLIMETENMKETAKNEKQNIMTNLQNIKANVNSMIDKLAKEIENLASSSKKQEDRLDAVEENQERALEYIQKVEENTDLRISDVETQLQVLSSDHSTLRVQHNILDERVAGIEEKHEQLESRVSDLTEHLAMPAMTSPDSLFYAPDRNSCFCGREKELDKLQEKAAMANDSCVTTAICGLGGVGKSTLAVEHVWDNNQKYTGGVFHVSGENHNLFQISLNEMARCIGTGENNFSETLNATLHWLQSSPNPWCLVVDNLDEAELSSDIMKLLNGKWRRNVRGHILITSRREPSALALDVNMSENDCIELKSLSEEEAISFMKRRTKRHENEKALEKLVEELGCLPLALEQASAYILLVKCSFTDYFEEYKKRRLNLLKERKGRYLENTSPERLAVHTTWLINFSYISKLAQNPDTSDAAVLVMEVSAFLAPENIPFEVVNEGLPPIKNRALESSVQNKFGAKEVLSLLTRFSLFNRLSMNSYDVHRLVQELIRDNVDVHRKHEVLRCALRMLHYAFVHTSSPTEVCNEVSVSSSEDSTCRPLLHLWGKLACHAFTLQEHVVSFITNLSNPEIQKELLHQEETAKIFGESAIYLSLCHDPVKALELQKRQLECLGGAEVEVQQKRMNRLLLPLSGQNARRISQGLKEPEEAETDEYAADFERIEQESVALRQEGNEYFKRKNFLEAGCCYSKAIDSVAARFPDRVDLALYANRAACYLSLEEPEKALADCDKALALVKATSDITFKVLKVYYRKAWALHKLVMDGKHSLRNRAKAAAVKYAYYSTKLNEQCDDKKRFPQVPFISVSNATELQFVITTSPPDTTFLLEPGEYKLSLMCFLGNLRVIGLNKDEVCLKFRDYCNFAGNVYVEDISFPVGGCPIEILAKANCEFYSCKISGGFIACGDYPECNGGERCIAVSKGKSPCNRQYNYGNRTKPSGIEGLPAMRICSESKVKIEECEISFGGSYGLIVNDKHSKLVIEKSSIHNNTRGGIQAMDGGSVHLMKCKIYENGEEGVLIGERAGKCTIEGNEIFDNGNEGIIISTTKVDTVVQKNNIYQNRSFGASFHGCSAIVCQNILFQNAFWGIGIEQGSTVFIKDNTIARNQCGGIFMNKNFSGRVIIQENKVKDHSGPWLYFSKDEVKGLSNPIKTFSGVKERDLYTSPPTLVKNINENNREGCCHPRDKVQLISNFCTYCNAEGKDLKRCAGCRSVVYCSVECQKKHWQQHKGFCQCLTDRFSVSVVPIDKHIVELEQSEKQTNKKSVRIVLPEMVASSLKGLGEGLAPNPEKKERFIVKLQTWLLNSHPLQTMRLYDKSMGLDCYIQSPILYHLIMECGVLGSLVKFTSKKIFLWAEFTDKGRRLRLFFDELAPLQQW